MTEAILLVKSADPRLKYTLNSLAGAGPARVSVIVNERARSFALSVLKTWSTPHRVVFYREQAGPAPALNLCRARSRARFIAYLESGDLIDARWLEQGARALGHKSAARTIFYPQSVVIGDPVGRVHRVPDQRTRSFALSDLLWQNPWPPVFIARRTDLRRCPWRGSPRGFSSSLWQWNLRAIEQGLTHRPLASTVCLVRAESDFARELLDRSAGLRQPPSSWLRKLRPSPESVERTAPRASPEHSPRQAERVGRFLADQAWIDPALAAFTARSKKGAALEFLERPDFLPLSRSFLRMKEIVGTDTDYLLLIHQLRRGGAELEALHHLRTFCAENPGAKTVVFITESSDPDWLDRLPRSVRSFEFGRKVAQHLAPSDQVLTLGALLLVCAPRRVHVKHSWQGWDLLRDQGVRLSVGSRLYASLYCVDYLHDGTPVSFAYSHLIHCWRNLSAVFCDNHFFARQLREQCGITRTVTLRFPTDTPVRMPRPAPRPAAGAQSMRPLRVLWASRIAPQKGVEHLLAVARAFPQHRFEMYGEFSVRPPARFREELLELPNLFFHGGFDSLESIDLSAIDVFLYTARWDGLPNILLEAAQLGLPIIAPDVGGIAELIGPKTGYLAQTPADFARQLRQIARNPAQAARRAEALQRLIARRHSPVVFKRALARTPGYLREGKR